MAVKTRFAPSPTGFFHMGSLYASFMDLQMAKQTKGICMLRIEDTDGKRTVNPFEYFMAIAQPISNNPASNRIIHCITNTKKKKKSPLPHLLRPNDEEMTFFLLLGSSRRL